MKIGLIGAPGSGKTEFAAQLARRLTEGKYLPVAVVDNYVERVEEEMDLGTGMLSSYVADAAIALGRLGDERTAEREGAQTIITCGTLIDTATHTAVNCTLEKKSEVQEDTELVNWPWMVGTTTMPWYSLLATSALDYDRLFVMPAPILNDDTYTYNHMIHDNLRYFIEQFAVTVTWVTDPKDIETIVGELA